MEPRIPGFEILEPLGQGAMSSVWRARDVATRQIVALKVVHPHVAIAPGLLDRFLHEVRAYQRLRHPNIVSCLADGHEGDCWYVALEELGGGDLRSLLRAAGRLPPESAAFVLAEVLAGLAHAHQAQLVHRDVKPENVMLAADGAVKLSDFGISLATDFTRLTEAGTLIGTPAYMAPEQARAGESSPRSDLWSAGVLFYEMVTGVNPFAADHPSATIARLATRTPAPMGYRAPAVPPELEDLSVALLERDPQNRPGSADEVLERLRPLLAGYGEWATRDAIRRLLVDTGAAVQESASQRALPRLERARSLLQARPPRLAAGLYEASEALAIDPASDRARELIRDAGDRSGVTPDRRPSARALELEREAEDNSTNVSALLNLVRLSRAEGDVRGAARAYRWGRRRSRDDRFAFAQLTTAVGLELAAHLEGLHPDALEARLKGRGAGISETRRAAAPLFSSRSSSAFLAALLALLALVAWSAFGPSRSVAPAGSTARAARRALPTATPPDPFTAVLERATQVADQGDTDRALSLYQLFLIERPQDRRVPEVRFRVARALQELQRTAEARSAYREIMALWPQSEVGIAARRRLAYLLEDERDYDGALEALAGITESPEAEDRASLALQRGHLHELRGDFATALELYGHIESQPFSSNVRAKARLGHARILVAREDPDARRWIARAVAGVDADSPVAVEAAALEQRLTQAEAARELPAAD